MQKQRQHACRRCLKYIVQRIHDPTKRVDKASRPAHDREVHKIAEHYRHGKRNRKDQQFSLRYILAEFFAVIQNNYCQRNNENQIDVYAVNKIFPHCSRLLYESALLYHVLLHFFHKKGVIHTWVLIPFIPIAVLASRRCPFSIC